MSMLIMSFYKDVYSIAEQQAHLKLGDKVMNKYGVYHSSSWTHRIPDYETIPDMNSQNSWLAKQGHYPWQQFWTVQRGFKVDE